MSRELAEAIKAKNIHEVERLLALPGSDLNYITIIDRNEEGSLVTLAIHLGCDDIALLLIKRGARVDVADCDHYEYKDIYHNAYVILTTRSSINPKILKTMLPNVSVLNPAFDGWGKDKRVIKVLMKPSGSGPLARVPAHNNLNELMSLIGHEALLRSQLDLIMMMYGPASEYRDLFIFRLSAESLRDYLSDRELTHRQIHNLLQSISALVKNKIITAATEVDLIAYLKTKYKGVVGAESFPEKLRAGLNIASHFTLEIAWCELVALLYPEHNLPPISVDNATYQTMDHSAYNEDLKIVRHMQQPVFLRVFLDTDETAILMRLANAKTETGENRALQLLAIIVFHYAESRQLLDEKQRARALQHIISLCSFTRTEELLLQTAQKQSADLYDLRLQTQELTGVVTGLQTQLARMERLLLESSANAPAPAAKRRRSFFNEGKK